LHLPSPTLDAEERITYLQHHSRHVRSPAGLTRMRRCPADTPHRAMTVSARLGARYVVRVVHPRHRQVHAWKLLKLSPPPSCTIDPPQYQSVLSVLTQSPESQDGSWRGHRNGTCHFRATSPPPPAGRWSLSGQLGRRSPSPVWSLLRPSLQGMSRA
jgi:hypothetical protein